MSLTKQMADVQAKGTQPGYIAGSFRPDGTNAPLVGGGKGAGWSVARSGVGDFTVTLTEVPQNILSVQATLQTADRTLAGLAQLGDIDRVAGTIQITVFDEGASIMAEADPASDENARVHFVVFFEDSLAGPPDF